MLPGFPVIVSMADYNSEGQLFLAILQQEKATKDLCQSRVPCLFILTEADSNRTMNQSGNFQKNNRQQCILISEIQVKYSE